MSLQATWRGGCLCGAFRYEAQGAPLYAGCCYCADCRKACGGGSIGFLGFKAEQLRFSGETVSHGCLAASGAEAVRTRCAVCGSLVMGGRAGAEEIYNLYAGSLDEPERFEPKIAIFTRDRPAWASLPEGLEAFQAMPPRA